MFFDDQIPEVYMQARPMFTQKMLLQDLYTVPLGATVKPDGTPLYNHELVSDRAWIGYEHLFNLVQPGETLLDALIRHWDVAVKVLPHDSTYYRHVARCRDKLAAGGRVWNKDPERQHEDDQAPSLSSVAEFIHPTLDRAYTIREYARLMGYPDDFQFYPNGKTSIVQCIAQGVPARFVEYIATEINAALANQRSMLSGSRLAQLCFQHHTHKVAKLYDGETLRQLSALDHNTKSSGFWTLT
jgi:Site-specific DNA methylase